MVLGRVQTALKVGAGALALAQVGTIAALMVVDRRRKRHRGHVNFPSKPPEPLFAGEDELTVYTRGRDLFDDMIATIEAATFIFSEPESILPSQLSFSLPSSISSCDTKFS